MPDLSPENEDFWFAYLDLSATLTYSEINAYAELMDLDKTELTVKIHAIKDTLTDKVKEDEDGNVS